MCRIIYLSTVATLLLTSAAWADVRLPKVLGSHMVLQRNSVVKIWGWADPGETVSVRADWLDSAAASVTDVDGYWLVRIRTGKAGGPHTMTITGTNTIQLEDPGATSQPPLRPGGSCWPGLPPIV